MEEREGASSIGCGISVTRNSASANQPTVGSFALLRGPAQLAHAVRCVATAASTAAGISIVHSRRRRPGRGLLDRKMRGSVGEDDWDCGRGRLNRESRPSRSALRPRCEIPRRSLEFGSHGILLRFLGSVSSPIARNLTCGMSKMELSVAASLSREMGARRREIWREKGS
jgi:hypothetical protein